MHTNINVIRNECKHLTSNLMYFCGMSLHCIVCLSSQPLTGPKVYGETRDAGVYWERVRCMRERVR